MVKVRFGILLPIALLAPAAIAQTRGAATVSGIVTDAVTHLPVTGAQVRIEGDSARTDSEGNYELTVKSGSTRIEVQRIGYLSFYSELETVPAAALRRDFELRPGPRISGSVVDADSGQPLAGCIVFASRRILSAGDAWYAASGIPTAGIPPADSRKGNFETVALASGDYILEVTGCAWSYYPGVDRLDMAASVTVTETGTRGLTSRVRSQGRRVSGLAELGAVDVRLVRHIQDAAQTLDQVRADASGHFEFKNVPEGEFHLVTSAGAHQVIAVTDHDLTDVELKSEPAVKPAFTIRMLESDLAVPTTLVPELVPVFDGEPGPQWPRLNGLPPGYALASVESTGTQIIFLVTSKTGRLSGTVAGPGAVVIAVREPMAEYLDQSLLPRARVEKGNSWSLTNLAPGKYRVFALTGEEQLLERNEAFLRKKAALATWVEVAPEATAHIDLK